MRVLVVALTDLSIMSGTYARVSGQILSTLSEIDRYYVVSYGLSDEIKSHKKVVWIKPAIRKGKGKLALLASSCGVVSQYLAGYISNDLFIQSDVFQKRRINIVHLHHLFTVNVTGRLFKYKIPKIIDIHGLSRLQIQSPYDLKIFLYEKILKILEPRIIKNVSKSFKLIVPTKSMKEYIKGEFKIATENIYVVPDGIFINEIPQISKNKIYEIREKLEINDKIVITYMGMLSLYHGFYDLVVAFNKISKKLHNSHFLFIIPKGSSGIVFRYLKNLSFTILENVPRKEVYPFLQASDVLVIPHRAGTQFEYLYSNKLLDYVASGRPIVGYSTRAIREFLANYPLKILVEPNNPLKLAEGILAATEYKEEYVNGIEYLREYDWNLIGKKLLEIYNFLLQQ